MSVFRAALSRELLVTLSAVSAVLLVIIMSGRFIKYLAQAAQGLLDPGVLLMIMGFRLPGFLQLILPLGLFLGGVRFYAGDPGLGIALVPIGGAALLYATIHTAHSLWRRQQTEEDNKCVGERN